MADSKENYGWDLRSERVKMVWWSSQFLRSYEKLLLTNQIVLKISINFFYFYIKKIFFTLTSSHFFLGSEIFLVASLKNKKEKDIDKHEINSCKMETKLPN